MDKPSTVERSQIARSSEIITGQRRTTCDVCGDVRGAPWMTVRDFPLRRCEACGFRWMEDVVRADWTERLYERAYFEGAQDGYPNYLATEAAVRASARRNLDRLERRHPGRGRLLDVGCAAGFLLDEARFRGWDVMGVEPSTTMAAHARDRFGLDIVPKYGCLPGAKPETFDALTMVQILEHLDDPVGLCLPHARTLLRPGGHLLIETWDAASHAAQLFGRRWHQLSPPSVRHWFTAPSIVRALQRAGFEVLEIDHPSKPVHIDTALFHLGKSDAGQFISTLARGARWAARGLALADRFVPYPFDDLLRVIARRPQAPDAPVEV